MFDPEFYCLQNIDVAESGDDPFTHYLRHGWREGRAPNARFDDGHYRATAGLTDETPVSSLAHFVAFGQKMTLSPVPGVDLEALRRANPDLAVARMSPYRQLLNGRLAQSPSPRPRLSDVLERISALAEAPEVESGADVDVIVPVFLGRAETLNTIWHVLSAKTRTRIELIVIDDGSPDPKLASDLVALANRNLIHLIAQRGNSGFVAAINRGSQVHPDRDVIWLNADTEVYDGWVDRLRAAAYSEDRVATVTPMTNNGTICSYPLPDTDNCSPLEIEWQDLDRWAATVNAGISVVAPTAVGFATYVRRDALASIGPLDQAAFGLGYGEENDFSQRALAQGWSNLIAADVLARHFGATSFGSSRTARVDAALKVIDQRYPSYRRDVRAFQAMDPLATARRQLDLARLQCLGKRKNVLLISHSLGGGTQQHVNEEIARLSKAGWSVYLLTGGGGGSLSASLTHYQAQRTPELEDLSLDDPFLWAILTRLRIDEVHIHHLIDFGADAARVLARTLAQAELPYDFILHDYYAMCPRVNLVDQHGMYCGEPGISACQRCILRRGSRRGRVDIRRWRKGYAALLEGARSVRVPDGDAAKRLSTYFPNVKRLQTKPHEADFKPAAPRIRSATGTMNVALLGSIGATKGFDSLLALARHVRRHRLPMRFTVIGQTKNDSVAAQAAISITGAYLNDEVDDLITEVSPDLIWLPSLWPETYSYTLSIALSTGLPVAVYDLGAQANRILTAKQGLTIPLADALRPERLYVSLKDAIQTGSNFADRDNGLKTVASR